VLNESVHEWYADITVERMFNAQERMSGIFLDIVDSAKLSSIVEHH
jgi:hypothetical protein